MGFDYRADIVYGVGQKEATHLIHCAVEEFSITDDMIIDLLEEMDIILWADEGIQYLGFVLDSMDVDGGIWTLSDMAIDAVLETLAQSEILKSSRENVIQYELKLDILYI